MSSTQKRGFRLPWAAERSPEEAAGAVALDPGSVDPARLAEIRGAVNDRDDGPIRRAESTTPAPSTDADPAASDVPHAAAEAAMMETKTSATEPTEATQEAAAAEAGKPGAWPSMDRAAGSSSTEDRDGASARPPIYAQNEPRIGRRDNPLVAGLVKAMREAAIASREETTSRLQAEATARVEAIRAGATDASAELRKRADDDIAGIREWSKTEIARIRQETDDRIEARRVELTGETERHAAHVERQVDAVQTTVTAFEADMDGFFEQLLAETDPARLAALAEQAPDPPEFGGDPAEATKWQATEEAGEAQPAPTGLQADAAAEAEAEATEGLDLPSGNDAWPAAVLAAARRNDADGADDADDAEPEGSGHTRLLVSGLTSVAGISAFKGAVGQLAGVHTVSVSSGEKGVFVFTVSHDPGVDLADGVAGLTGFAAHVTDAEGDNLAVSAHEPAA